jgi:hypothetical protein
MKYLLEQAEYDVLRAKITDAEAQIRKQVNDRLNCILNDSRLTDELMNFANTVTYSVNRREALRLLRERINAVIKEAHEKAKNAQDTERR